MKNMDLPFSEREIKMVGFLLQGPATAEKIAKNLGISRRTVLRELPDLSKKLEAFNVTLERKAGSGLSLKGDEEDLKRLRRELESTTGQSRITPEERRQAILLYLLEQKEPVKLYAIASRFNVTEATISYDLDRIEENVSRYGLKLLRRPGLGVRLEGPEEGLRQLILDLFYRNFQEDQLLKILKDNIPGGKPPQGFNSGEVRDRLLKLIDARVVEKIERALDDLLDDLKFPLADSAYAGLVVHIALALDRLKGRDTVSMDQNLLMSLKKTREFDLADKLSRELERSFGIKIPEEETGYITMHLLGAKIRADGGFDEFFLIDHREATEAAGLILQKAGEELGTDLLQDRRALEDLAVHLKPAISRLCLGMEIRNPLIKELRQNYPRLMEVAQKTARIIEDKFGVKVPEPELGFIAMHIGAALERKEGGGRVKVLLVCASGIGSARMLAGRVKKELPELDVQQVVSLADVMKALEKDPFVDMVLTTVPLELDGIPALKVSPLLTEQDIRSIRERLKLGVKNRGRSGAEDAPLKADKADTGGRAGVIFDLLEDFMLKEGIEARDIRELVTKIAGTISDAVPGVCRAKIKEDLFSRHNMAGCGVPGKGLAVLHARSAGVAKPFLGVFRLKNPLVMRNMDGALEAVSTSLVMLLPSNPSPGEREVMGQISAAIIEDPGFDALLREGAEADIIRELLKILR
ncbi:BglG family transcription antiterminator [Thermoanaerobacterium sp. DL9XJH110]|uniref:BglG family transcription antiterminator n=1 Tax=Thermoanaerobacterium sp. DL9XJH110 TaxID=3386643 RepID=UPI003BB6C800